MQGLNRFAYVNNNPINFNDPSGHGRDCGLGMGCVVDPPSVTEQLAQFGITVKKSTYAHRKSMLEAAQLTGEKFAEIMGDSPEDAFRRAHGDITIAVTGERIYAPDGNLVNCITIGGSITCTNPMTVANAIHEFGHVFDVRYRDLSTVDDIYENGVLKKNPTAGDYISQEWWGNPSGYLCGGGLPCVQNATANNQEDFADMYLNWVLDGNGLYPDIGFKSNELGQHRSMWMNSGAWYPNYGIPAFLANMGF